MSANHPITICIGLFAPLINEFLCSRTSVDFSELAHIIAELYQERVREPEIDNQHTARKAKD